MPVEINDLTGQSFGRLVVLGRPANERKHGARFVVKCSCGNEKIVRSQHLRNGTTKSCGCLRAELLSRVGEKHPNWKGGKSLNADGYFKLNLQGPNFRRFEHRVVMEAFLGRELRPDETVHHKNGIKTDNRIENLELKCSSHGRGQEIQDLVKWAKEILGRYCPEALR